MPKGQHRPADVIGNAIKVARTGPRSTRKNHFKFQTETLPRNSHVLEDALA